MAWDAFSLGALSAMRERLGKLEKAVCVLVDYTDRLTTCHTCGGQYYTDSHVLVDKEGNPL